MKKIIYSIFLLSVISCQTAIKPDIDELLVVDRSFSDKSVETGFNKAFIEFAHPDAVLLRQNSMPVIGINRITDLYKNVNSDGIVFTWEPLGGNIAASGELGYIYGIYTFIKDSVIKKGTYVSVWKKDKQGQWKYILDSGNEGIGEETTIN